MYGAEANNRGGQRVAPGLSTADARAGASYGPGRYCRCRADEVVGDHGGRASRGEGAVSDAVRLVESDVREVIRRTGSGPGAPPVGPGSGWSRRRSPTMTSAASWVGCRSCSTGTTRSRASSTRSPVFGALQKYFGRPAGGGDLDQLPSAVFIARGGGIAEPDDDDPHRGRGSRPVERMLRSSGRRVDLSSPFVDATFCRDGPVCTSLSRISREHWHINIRKFVVKADHPDDLVRLGTVTRRRLVSRPGRRWLQHLPPAAPRPARRRCSTALRGDPARERVVTRGGLRVRRSVRDGASMQCRQVSL